MKNYYRDDPLYVAKADHFTLKTSVWHSLQMENLFKVMKPYTSVGGGSRRNGVCVLRRRSIFNKSWGLLRCMLTPTRKDSAWFCSELLNLMWTRVTAEAGQVGNCVGVHQEKKKK